MEFYYATSITLLIFTTIIFFSKLFTKSRLPPGPFQWPIIGNIHELGDKPHRAVAELANKYGPIMSLKLGSMVTIVISSPETAKELFLKHDVDLSGRGITDATRAVNHDKLSLVFLPVCPLWRKFRKISTMQLFTAQRLVASEHLRQNKIDELVEYARQCSERGLPVDIGKAAFTTTLNLLSNTLFSTDLASHTSSNSQDFRDLVRTLMEVGAAPNVSDFFPLIRGLDLQGLLKRSTINVSKTLKIFEEIIEERLRDSNLEGKDDVLTTLLHLVENKELSFDEVTHLLFDLFVAGSDTTSTTLEWAMTELLLNPQKMKKARVEVEQVIGKEGLVRESDISKLPYIQAIVKETFRLHPPAPFLIPYKIEKDVELCGYILPKNAHVWVNVWSIGRYSKVWPNSLSFSPERFLERDINAKGRDFELIPYGAGRRICPGIPLADRMLHLMLTTLIHSFDWKNYDEVDSKSMDMEEKFGITLQKAKPLRAIPLPK